MLYPALLNNNADGGAGWYGSILTQETEGEKLLEQYGKKMDEGSSDQLWGEYGLSFDGSNPVTSAQALYGYAQSHNQLEQLGDRVAHYVDAGLTITPPTSTEAFMKAVVADDVIWESSALRAGGGFVPFVQQSLDRHGERSKLVSFFNGWTDSRYWLEQNSAPDQLFGVVLNDAPATVIGSHLSGESDAELISTVIADMPELTVGEYLSKLVTKGLLDGATMPEHEFGQITDTIRLAEHHIYGSSRLGVQRYAQQLPLMSTYQYGNPAVQVKGLSGLRPWYSAELGDWTDSTKKDVWALDTAGNKDVRSWKVSRILGYRSYELSDHLGNVLATVLDRKTGKVPVDVAGGLQQYSYWNADLASVQDYYPFGMQMPGRFKEAGDTGRYRYLSQGQIHDDEIYGKGSSYAFKYRLEDSRTNRFWSVDPLFKTYPWNSSYAFSENRLTDGVELEGLEFVPTRVSPNTAPRLQRGNDPIPTGTARWQRPRGRAGTGTPSMVPPPGSVQPQYYSGRDQHGEWARWNPDRPLKFEGEPGGPPAASDYHPVSPEQAEAALKAAKGGSLRASFSGPPYERITTDAKKLSGWDLAEIAKRIREGNTIGMDLIYARELRNANSMYEVNPKHVGGDPDASMLPENHGDLWNNRSHYDGKYWWSKEGTGKKTVYHRFSGDGNGSFHWSGSTGDNYNRRGQKIKSIKLNHVPRDAK